MLFSTPGEEGATEDGKDGKSAKAKRSHFGRAVSLKNFIMRKGKSTSVDTGEGAKEEEATEGGEAAAVTEEGGADGEAAAAIAEANDKDAATAAEKTPAEESGAEVAKEPEKEPEKTTAEAPVTNGENGCSNGTEEENATHNHQEEEEKTTGSSPMKKSKEAGGVKDEANAKIINATAAVNSGELEHADRDSDEPQNSSSSSKDGEANGKRQEALINDSNKRAAHRDRQTQIALAVSGEKGEGQGVAESPQNGGCHDAKDSHDQREGEEEEMRKRDLRDAAVVIVQNVMSAATDQLEKELCVDNGLNGCYDADARY